MAIEDVQPGGASRTLPCQLIVPRSARGGIRTSGTAFARSEMTRSAESTFLSLAFTLARRFACLASRAARSACSAGLNWGV